MAELKIGKALDLAENLLKRVGVPADKSASTARSIVTSDRWGIGSHGLMRLPYYLERLMAGGINPLAEMLVVTDLPSLVIFDGQNGLGHWQLQRAAEEATRRAQINGIAAVGVGRSSHCGALGIYVWPMLRSGLLGIAFSTGPAVMPPWGGNQPVLSTSPLAAGIPTNPPTIVDLATSTVARGKIAARAQARQDLEPGWAFDAEGVPTINAEEALVGMLAPLGGAKGYALAVLVESLTGVLVGPKIAKEIPDMFSSAQTALPQEISHFIIALDAEKLSVDGINDRKDRFQSAIKDGGGRLPGSNRLNPQLLDREENIAVTDTVMDQLESWSKRLAT